MKNSILIYALLVVGFFSCSEDENPQAEQPKLIIKLDVSQDQERLGNTGQLATIPEGNAGQNPVFNSLSAHYIEFAQNATTALGKGAILYEAAETSTGGDEAIDFDQSIVVAPGEKFLEIPLSDLKADTYEWVRLSLSYQNYDISFYYNDSPLTGTVASFVGFNTYIKDYTVKDKSVSVNANKKQGYWGLETIIGVLTGQAPEGATTVPNPIFASSPIPQGSCVVTGEFAQPLTITGDETEDVVVTMSLSVNKSFEWEDTNGNGKWDVEENANEKVVDMGLRGLVPIVE